MILESEDIKQTLSRRISLHIHSDEPFTTICSVRLDIREKQFELTTLGRLS